MSLPQYIGNLKFGLGYFVLCLCLHQYVFDDSAGGGVSAKECVIACGEWHKNLIVLIAKLGHSFVFHHPKYREELAPNKHRFAHRVFFFAKYVGTTVSPRTQTRA